MPTKNDGRPTLQHFSFSFLFCPGLDWEKDLGGWEKLLFIASRLSVFSCIFPPCYGMYYHIGMDLLAETAIITRTAHHGPYFLFMSHHTIIIVTSPLYTIWHYFGGYTIWGISFTWYLQP